MIDTKTLRKINLTWVLFFSVPLFLIIFLRYRHSPYLIFLLLTLATLIYLLVSLLHHLKDKTIRTEVILEYFLIALLALIIFQGLVI